MQHALQLMPINNVHSRLCAAMAYRVHYHACCVEITLNLSEWPWKEMIVDFDSIGATACDRATLLLAHHFINGIIIINTRERERLTHKKLCEWLVHTIFDRAWRVCTHRGVKYNEFNYQLSVECDAISYS